MNPGSIYTVLKRVRYRLNQIFIGIWTVRLIRFTACGAGLTIIVGRWLGWTGATLTTWGLVTVCGGGLTGAAIGWMKRINQQQAALWVDEHFHDHEAYSAALVSLARNCSGALDILIVERAVTIAAQDRKIGWPLRHLRRESLCAGIVFLLNLLLIIVIPVRLTANPGSKPALHPILKKESRPNSRGEQGIAFSNQTSREIAGLLFPEDPRLSAAAEQALRRGDINGLKELLQKAAVAMEEKLGKSPTETAKENLRQELAKRG